MLKAILVAIGSNLPDRHGHDSFAVCQFAASKVSTLPGLRLQATSAWYSTAPVPASDQPDFINGVIRLEGILPPAAILASLHQIEAEAGRERSVANAARVLDLDLLAVDDQIIDRPELTLPHPRLAERAFVLYPLCDVAPAWRHPVLGLTALELRDRLPPQRIARL